MRVICFCGTEYKDKQVCPNCLEPTLFPTAVNPSGLPEDMKTEPLTEIVSPDGLALCLDGPHNGEYIPIRDAVFEGYAPETWIFDNQPVETVLIWRSHDEPGN